MKRIIVLTFCFSSFFSLSTFAMSKKVAVEECLKELKISKYHAETCKKEGWNNQQCLDIKAKLKTCVRPKVFGF